MVKAIYDKEIQPEKFEFTPENKIKVSKIIARYPKGGERSAVMPLLDMAQRQNNNWIPRAAMDEIAKILDMQPIEVYEVATFYTMYNLKPVGKYHIQVCGTTPCMLCGSKDIMRTCKRHLDIEKGETTADGMFTLSEVECIGACVNAPAIQINDDYYEDLTPETMVEILDSLASGKKPKIGTQIDRQNSAPRKTMPVDNIVVEKVSKKKNVDEASEKKVLVKKPPVKKSLKKKGDE